MSPLEQVARFLAAEHTLEDLGLQAIYWSPCDEAVRLIEVTTTVPECQAVKTLLCAPDPPYVRCNLQMVLLHPADWARVEAGHLELPATFRPFVQLHSVA